MTDATQKDLEQDRADRKLTQKNLEQDQADKRLNDKLDAIAKSNLAIVTAMTEMQERLQEEIREVKDNVTGLDERLETLRPIENAINRLHSILQK